MFEKAIQKLKTEKSNLTSEARQSDIEYKSEIQRIDTAIQKFEEGIAALYSKDLLPRIGATAEIENVLAENGAMHVRDIMEELHRRAHSMHLQSMSCALQTAAKEKQIYKRISPAIFALVSKSKRTARPNTVV